MATRTVLQGLLFFPRGGSAQTVRYLAAALPATGWDARIVAGSAGAPDDLRNARRFFAGLDVHPVDYTPAFAVAAGGGDPLDLDVPLQPSYEDRPGAPDRVFTRVSPALAARQVQSWERALTAAGAAEANVLHLHHLTPLHDAVERCWPSQPIVTHLHGTELLMLERIAAGSPAGWDYAGYWAGRLRTAAARSAHVLTVSPDHKQRALAVLPLPPERISVVPNGVDLDRFRRRPVSTAERLALLRRWLVDDPQGWDESGVVGSVRYRLSDLDAFIDPVTRQPRPVLLFVGRFTEVKRLPLLLRAYARVRAAVGPAAPLLVWGGHPGEWEGEHPVTVARAEGVEGVFFTGWRGHDELPLGLSLADLLVVPSVQEAFGTVYLEAMAAGVPVVAARSGGPESFVNTDPGRPDGWLVDRDDEDGLVAALVEALTRPAVRRERATRGEAFVRARYSWAAIAEQVAAVYERVLR